MWGVLISAGTSLIQYLLPRVFAMLGVAAVSNTIIDPVFDYIHTKITSNFSGLGSDAYDFLSFVGVPDAVSILFSTITLIMGIRAAKLAFSKKASTDA